MSKKERTPKRRQRGRTESSPSQPRPQETTSGLTSLLTRRKLLIGGSLIALGGLVAAATCDSPLVPGVSSSINDSHLKSVAREVEAMNRAAYRNPQVLMEQTPRILEFANEILNAGLGAVYRGDVPVRFTSAINQFEEAVAQDMPCTRGILGPLAGLYLWNSAEALVDIPRNTFGPNKTPYNNPTALLLYSVVHEKLHGNATRKPVEASDYNDYMLSNLPPNEINTKALFKQGAGVAFEALNKPSEPNKPCIVVVRAYLEESIVDDATRRFYVRTGISVNSSSTYDNLIKIYRSRALQNLNPQDLLVLQQQSKGREIIEALGKANNIQNPNLYSKSDRFLRELLAPAA